MVLIPFFSAPLFFRSRSQIRTLPAPCAYCGLSQGKRGMKCFSAPLRLCVRITRARISRKGAEAQRGTSTFIGLTSFSVPGLKWISKDGSNHGNLRRLLSRFGRLPFERIGRRGEVRCCARGISQTLQVAIDRLICGQPCVGHRSQQRRAVGFFVSQLSRLSPALECSAVRLS